MKGELLRYHIGEPPEIVTPAKAGVPLQLAKARKKRDSRVRGNDVEGVSPLAPPDHFCGQIRNFSPVALA